MKDNEETAVYGTICANVLPAGERVRVWLTVLAGTYATEDPHTPAVLLVLLTECARQRSCLMKCTLVWLM